MKVAILLLILLILSSFATPVLTSIVESITMPVVKAGHNFIQIIGRIIGILDGDGDELPGYPYPT